MDSNLFSHSPSDTPLTSQGTINLKHALAQKRLCILYHHALNTAEKYKKKSVVHRTPIWFCWIFVSTKPITKQRKRSQSNWEPFKFYE